MLPELEKEFEITTKLLFGTALSGIESFGPWLSRHVPASYPVLSALSGKEVWVPPPLNYMRRKFNRSKIISMDEMEQVNHSPFTADDLKGAKIENIRKKLIVPIAYYCGNFRYGEHHNIENSSGAGAGMNIFQGEDVYLSVKNIGYSNYALYCENMFGCHGITHSKFGIHIYNSTNVTRCFEVDGCSNSSDLYFCHNCEGVSNGILCFNAKNLRYAVGNIEVGPEKFMRIKKMLTDYSVKELTAKKSLEVDIFNAGVRK
jgi:hypothetical protein